MKITIESTSMIVTLETKGGIMHARLWEGTTERGVPVHCYITRISPSIPQDQLTGETLEQFSRDLLEQATPSVAIAGIWPRLIL